MSFSSEVGVRREPNANPQRLVDLPSEMAARGFLWKTCSQADMLVDGRGICQSCNTFREDSGDDSFYRSNRKRTEIPKFFKNAR